MSTLGSVQYIGEIHLVHQGMFSTSERYHEYIGGLHEYIRQGFPQAVYTWGICPPQYGGTSARGKIVNGGLMRGDIDLMGGPNFDGLHHKLKVLLLLSCNYMMQFISYDSIETC